MYGNQAVLIAWASQTKLTKVERIHYITKLKLDHLLGMSFNKVRVEGKAETKHTIPQKVFLSSQLSSPSLPKYSSVFSSHIVCCKLIV